jgi:uncharacterized protein YecE (DUF72 family)
MNELREWADRLAELAREAEVLAYFNNDWEGFAVRNALALRGMLERRLGDAARPAIARPVRALSRAPAA